LGGLRALVGATVLGGLWALGATALGGLWALEWAFGRFVGVGVGVRCVRSSGICMHLRCVRNSGIFNPLNSLAFIVSETKKLRNLHAKSL